MPERFDKAARAGDSAKGLRHYLSRLQKARRRGNARKIAKFEGKVQKYNNSRAAADPEYAVLETKVLKKMCRVRQGTVTELERGATQEEMCMVKKLVETMLSIQSNLQAQAYYAEHTKAIAAGEEWVYPHEHPVVTVGSVDPGEARLILEELGELGHVVVDDDDEYLKALEQAALALADIRAMSVMHTCFDGRVGISPQGRTLKLALIHANCRSLFHDYNSEQAQRLRKKLLLARLHACQGVDGTE